MSLNCLSIGYADNVVSGYHSKRMLPLTTETRTVYATFENFGLYMHSATRTIQYHYLFSARVFVVRRNQKRIHLIGDASSFLVNGVTEKVANEFK